MPTLADILAPAPSPLYKEGAVGMAQHPDMAVLGPQAWAELHAWAERFRAQVGDSCGCGEFAVMGARAFHDLVSHKLGKPVMYPEDLKRMAEEYAKAAGVVGARQEEPPDPTLQPGLLQEENMGDVHAEATYDPRDHAGYEGPVYVKRGLSDKEFRATLASYKASGGVFDSVTKGWYFPKGKSPAPAPSGAPVPAWEPGRVVRLPRIENQDTFYRIIGALKAAGARFDASDKTWTLPKGVEVPSIAQRVLDAPQSRPTASRPTASRPTASRPTASRPTGGSKEPGPGEEIVSRGEGYGGTPYEVGRVYRRKDGSYWTALRVWSDYIREDGLSFGVGDDSGHIYSAIVRPATAEESMPVEARRAAKDAKDKAIARLEAIARQIDQTGVLREGGDYRSDPPGMLWDWRFVNSAGSSGYALGLVEGEAIISHRDEGYDTYIGWDKQIPWDGVLATEIRTLSAVAGNRPFGMSQPFLSQSFLDTVVNTALATATSIGVAKALSASVVPGRVQPVGDAPSNKEEKEEEGKSKEKVMPPVIDVEHVTGDQAQVNGMAGLLTEIDALLQDKANLGEVDVDRLEVTRQ